MQPKKLILINRVGRQKNTRQLFLDSARKFNLEVIEIDPSSPLPTLDPTEHYLLYKIAVKVGKCAKKIFQSYSCATFGNPFHFHRQITIFKHAKISMPKTFYLDHNASQEQLKKQTEEIGGFPLVLKIMGNYGGVGVIKCDNFEGFRTQIKIISKLHPHKKILIRQFINHTHKARLVVVGDKIGASYKVSVPSHDFRTKNKEELLEKREFSREANELAIKAVHARGWEFAGVDVIFDEEGKPYIAELNNPCYLGNVAKVTGVNIADKMLRHLIKKSQPALDKHKQRWPNPNTPPTLILIGPDTEEKKLLKSSAKYLEIPVLDIDQNKDLHASLEQDKKYLVYESAPNYADHYSNLMNPDNFTSLSTPNNSLAENQTKHVQKHKITRSDSLEDIKVKIQNIGGFPFAMTIQDNYETDTIKIESSAAFFSFTEYLLKYKKISIEPYLKTKQNLSLFVLQDQVLASIEYFSTKEDISQKQIAIPQKCPPEIEQKAIQALQNSGLECGVVNISTNEAGERFIEQIQPPYHFAQIQRATNTNLGQELIKLLLRKSSEPTIES